MNTLNKTIFPELVDTYIVSTSALLATYTNFLTLNQQYIDQVQTCINYELADSSCDFVNADVNFYSSLNYKLSTYDNEFIDYWLTRYNQAVTDIKTLVMSNIKNENFFQPWSDSIGLFTNTVYCLDDSTLSVTSSTYPTVFPVSINSKLSKHTLELTRELAYKTTFLYRKNISNIPLVPDITAVQRSLSSIQILTQLLNLNFDNVFKLVSFYCNLNNQSAYSPNNTDYNLQSIVPIDIQVSVEGTPVSVDLLGKKIKYARDSKTISQVLDYNTPPATISTNSIDQQFILSNKKNTNVPTVTSAYIQQSFNGSLLAQVDSTKKKQSTGINSSISLPQALALGLISASVYNIIKSK